MGREYPQGYTYFRDRCHNVFVKNRAIQDPEQIEKLLKHGDYIVNELKALYMLKKYRTLRRRYTPEDEMQEIYRLPTEPIDGKGKPDK